MRYCRLLSLCLLVLSFAASCAHYEKPKFNRGRGANGASTLIVPFRESKNRRWYGESKTGIEVTEAIRSFANENALEPEIRDSEEPDVKKVLQRLRDGWDKERVTAKEWKSLVASLGVEYVIEGDLVKMTLTHPKTINAYDARFVVEYRVINTVTGKIAYSGRGEGTFVSGRGGQDRIDWQSPSGESDRRVRQVVVQNLAENIAKDLFGFTEEGGW